MGWVGVQTLEGIAGGEGTVPEGTVEEEPEAEEDMSKSSGFDQAAELCSEMASRSEKGVPWGSLEVGRGGVSAEIVADRSVAVGLSVGRPPEESNEPVRLSWAQKPVRA